MKIYVFGSTGMLGNYVYSYFKNEGYDVVGFDRSNIDALHATTVELSALGIKSSDVIINCIGLIPQHGSWPDDHFKRVNSIFPHNINNFIKDNNVHFIHVTTDCVFSGKDGPYDEYSPHDEAGSYGKSKSLGELLDTTVIRTSIIGEEVRNKKSLLEWVKFNEGKEIDGYTNHVWNGITCLQFAKVCRDIIDNKRYWEGVRHIHSPEAITKYKLLENISDIYNLDIKVTPIETDNKCDRSLSTIYTDNIFNIPRLSDQIVQQKIFNLTN